MIGRGMGMRGAAYLWVFAAFGTGQDLLPAEPSVIPPCPRLPSIDLFRHQIVYQRTEEIDPFFGLANLRATVWSVADKTIYYVNQPLVGYPPQSRLAYVLGPTRLLSYVFCSSDQDWRDCISRELDSAEPRQSDFTCTLTLDLSGLPAWKESPHDDAKRKLIAELKSEIQSRWKGAQSVVIRDFNVWDPQITIWLRMSDGEYFQGCSFRATESPHCVDWHSFGQASPSSLRKRVFDLPVRLN
jgi:hypothetical protein